MKPWAMAHRKMVRIRCRTRRAVSGRDRPYWGQDTQYVPAVYPVQGSVAEDRHSMALQGLL